jgi:hypothetical protein
MIAAPIYAVLLFAGGTPAPPLFARIIPSVVEVGAFYRGARVRVEGVAAPRTQVIVTIAGSDREERYNRKGRIGPIWLNTGKVWISGAPSLYLQFSTEPVTSLLGSEAIDCRRLDEASLARRIHIEPGSGDPRRDAALRADYLALKRKSGIYGSAGRGLAMGQSTDRGTPFVLDLHWPANAPPAEYEVHVYEIRDRAVLRETCLMLPVVRTGFPAWLAGMAANRSSEYGIAAVLIGALAGFAIDFLATRLFSKKRRARSREMAAGSH